MAGETLKQGIARIELDQQPLLDKLDAISDGAASSVVRRASDVLDPIATGAQARWPVRSGLSKSRLALRSRVTEDRAQVEIVNTATAGGKPYAHLVRWSQRTKVSLRAEAVAYSRRGASAETQAALLEDKLRRLRWRHGEGAPSEAVRGKQPWRELVRRPGEKAMKALASEIKADLDKLAGG